MSGASYAVRFGPDIAGALRDDEYYLTEVIRAPDSTVDPGPPSEVLHARHDGTRLVLPLGPETTEDDTYSTIEVSSTRRFDQRVLDRAVLEGSPRVVIPGRQAIFRDVVFSPHFADGRAARESVTTGVTMQSWRGIEAGGMDAVDHPEFLIMSFAYIGGPGLMPMISARSLRRRPFAISVLDFKVGLWWFRPLRDYDSSEPHDLGIRWHADHDVSFTVDGREVGRYEDGKRRTWPLKLLSPKHFGAGTDFFGHKYLSVDPCHIDMWINSSVMGHKPAVPNGRRFGQDLWAAIGGFGIEPLD